MRYLLIVAVLAVLVVFGGGILLFTIGEDRTRQATRSTVTETSGGEGAEVVVASPRGLPAVPRAAGDSIAGDATPTPADAALVAATFEYDDEIERHSLAALQEDDTIERYSLALPVVADRQGPLATAYGAEALPIVASRAPDRAVARAPAERRRELVAEVLGRAEGAQVAASELVKAPQAPQAVAPRAPEQAVARTPVELRQALVTNGLGADEVAHVAASEIVVAPQTPPAVAPRAPERAVARAPTERRQALVANGLGRGEVAPVAMTEVDLTPQTPQAVAPRAPEQVIARAPTERRQELVADGLRRDEAAQVADGPETRAARTVVAALEPGAPVRRVAISGSVGVVPTFDVVRISPTGSAVIAGRAEPGADVVIIDGGRALGQVKADHLGEWVLVPLEALPPGTTELYVEASLPGVSPRRSDDVLVLSVPQRSVSRATEMAPLAVATPRGGGVTRVLQGTRRPVARDKGGPGVSLDVVDYDDAGNIVLSGRADASVEVRVYVDGRLVGPVRSDKKGDWQLRPDVRIPSGDHELRVDRVSVEGKALARAVLPFSRVDLQGLDLGDGRVVVQPGTSLWRIARATYGSGFQYTVIYDANRDRIDDPDLIFPGQVFKVPEPN